MSKRDFLRVVDFSRDEILKVIERAAQLKEKTRRGEMECPLIGKTLAMIFQKSSTRTRVSFEVAMYQMGGISLFLSPQDTQIGRGEPVKDTARVLSRYVDAVMIRTYEQEEVEEFARYSSVPVINGLTDLHHPCQILGDLLTAKEFGKDLFSMKVAFVGDGNNVANSWVEAAFRLGFELSLACPEGYDPHPQVLSLVEGKENVRITRDPREAVTGADVIYTDVWTSMGQEGEADERLRVFQGFTVDDDLVSLAREDAIVMHCLPAHRGEEITESVIEGERSVVFDQAENRLHIQKAILEFLIKGID
ncbi:MAG: ornithine carbamoyltransferase [Deltaproteobacteria bacterium]|nr:MAG: ornithine carbamoyltransferase [Deltaproteobacteria bacterium]